MIIPIPVLVILLFLSVLSLSAIVAYLARKANTEIIHLEDNECVVIIPKSVRSIVDEDLLMEDKLRG